MLGIGELEYIPLVRTCAVSGSGLAFAGRDLKSHEFVSEDVRRHPSPLLEEACEVRRIRISDQKGNVFHGACRIEEKARRLLQHRVLDQFTSPINPRLSCTPRSGHNGVVDNLVCEYFDGMCVWVSFIAEADLARGGCGPYPDIAGIDRLRLTNEGFRRPSFLATHPVRAAARRIDNGARRDDVGQQNRIFQPKDP